MDGFQIPTVYSNPFLLNSEFSFQVYHVGGIWTIHVSTLLKRLTLEFRVDETFQETTCDGRLVNTTVKRTGNAFHVLQIPIDPNDKRVEMKFEYYETGVILELKVHGTDVVCVQKFYKM